MCLEPSQESTMEQRISIVAIRVGSKYVSTRSFLNTVRRVPMHMNYINKAHQFSYLF